MITSLTLELRPGEAVRIGSLVTMVVERKTGASARFRFLADSKISIKRLEREPKTGPLQARQGVSLVS